MRLFLIVFIILGLLGGGGAGAYFYFAQGAEASPSEHAELAEKPKIDPSLLEIVELDTLIVPVVDRDGVSQVVSLVIGVGVESGQNVDLVKQYQPRLKSAYIQEMYGLLNRHAALKGGILHVKKIKERLTEISQDVLGPGKIHEVKLKVVQQRAV